MFACVLSTAVTMEPFLVVYALLWGKMTLLCRAKDRRKRKRRQCKVNLARERKICHYIRQKWACHQQLAVYVCHNLQ